MRDKIQQIREKALAEIDKADGLEKLNDVRAAILGKKGELTAVLKGMKDVAPDERPKVGQWVNETRELKKPYHSQAPPSGEALSSWPWLLCTRLHPLSKVHSNQKPVPAHESSF